MEDPDILEAPYEALMGEGRDQLYHDIFAHLDVPEDQAAIGVELMRLFEAKRPHRAGQGCRPGQEPAHPFGPQGAVARGTVA
jgi:hypothetical protein